MGKPSPENVAALAASFGRNISESQAKLLAVYLESVVAWNRKFNLVGPYGWEKVLEELVADSWHLADFVETLPLPDAPRTLDLGAGAGLPGIPLRVFWDAGDYRLVEMRSKRVVFMRLVLGKMKLPGTSVVGGKVESLGSGELPVDFVVSRAFKPWREVLGITSGLVDAGGVCVIMVNELPDDGDVPEGWQGAGAKTYEVAGKHRHFKAFVKL